MAFRHDLKGKTPQQKAIINQRYENDKRQKKEFENNKSIVKSINENPKKTNIREFDLNIEKVLENWTVANALREIIANALDEQVLSHTKDIQIYFDIENTLHIRDYGRGLKYIHLTQNENEEKINHPHLIGKFGVGLKDALATFDRNSKGVTIISKYGRITMGKSHKHGFDDITTLHAYIDDSSDKDFQGTEFIITDCSETDVSDAKNMFLKFSTSEVLSITQYGEVLEKIGNISDIYINGVKVAQEDNFLFSYNITSLTTTIKKALNRERTNVGRVAYSDRIKIILLNVSEEMVIEQLVDNLTKFSSGSIADELKWSDISAHAVRKLNSRENVVFMTPKEVENASGHYVDILKNSGKEIVFIPETVKEKVDDMVDDEGNDITTFSSIIEDYRESFEYSFVDYKDLTEKEKCVFDSISDITMFYDVEYLKSKICISETIQPDADGDLVAGVWDGSLDKIIIHRSQLNSFNDFAGTLIHEMVHAHKALHDVERRFEIELTRIIGVLAGGLLSLGLLKYINQDSESTQLLSIGKNIEKKLSGKVSLTEIFPDEFMQKNSRFENIQSFFDAADFNVETQEEYDKLDIQELDKNTRKLTSFLSWNNFLDNASRIYFHKKFDSINKETFIKPEINTNGRGCKYIYHNLDIHVNFG